MTNSKHRSISALGKEKETLGSRSTTATYVHPVSMLAVRERQGKAAQVLAGEGELSVDDVESVKGMFA